MKIVISLFLLVSSALYAQEENTLSIATNDSIMEIQAFIRKDHRIFGYEKPDKNSAKLIVFSIFTNDVENNPHHCKLGSYYDTTALPGTLKYTNTAEGFIKAKYIDNKGVPYVIYFESDKVIWETNE